MTIVLGKGVFCAWIVVAHLTSQQLTKARMVMQRTARSFTDSSGGEHSGKKGLRA